jgi:hypothetical protein
MYNQADSNDFKSNSYQLPGKFEVAFFFEI